MGNRPLFSHLLKSKSIRLWWSLAVIMLFAAGGCGANAQPTPPIPSVANADNPEE